MKDGLIDQSAKKTVRPPTARAMRRIAKAEEELSRERELFEKKASRIESRIMNRDPITGAPGSHGIGTGVGTAGGAVAGGALGSLAGPVGTAVGGFLGAILGALAGHGVSEAINPTAEEAYWRDMYGADTNYHLAHPYEDYAPAFTAGYLFRDRPWSEAESELRAVWESHKGSSPLSWDEVRDAAHAAWLHADRRNVQEEEVTE
ncbi:MAG TPA: hypothetical protein VGH80_05990 [Xanthomonadaceae bacterium]